jgi:hypothetical protein
VVEAKRTAAIEMAMRLYASLAPCEPRAPLAVALAAGALPYELPPLLFEEHVAGFGQEIADPAATLAKRYHALAMVCVGLCPVLLLLSAW